ncbi:PREDICTED: PHD finger protein MALE MEIOCYTE DEATH 1-like [Fragaria vesca subsp. vesca]
MSTQTDQTPNPSPIPTKKRTTRKRLRPCSNHSYELTTFCQPGRPISPTGPFQDNVVVFLQQCAELTDFRVQGMSVWFTLLRSRECLVPLFTIEETVDNSKTEFCDHCLSTDWSNHFVSKRKYHIIIPKDNCWTKPLNDSILEDTTHLLHGMIHCDGIGHLLCINGLKGGSEHFCGREIMDLWDRICTNLRTRKITVEDFSKKRSMELRLLHGIAYGHAWFGRWGYRFCYGSFGVAEETYERALDILSSIELEKIIQDFSDMEQCEELKRIIHCYKHWSESSLVTIKDLLKFMLTVKAGIPAPKKVKMPLLRTASLSSCTAHRIKPKLFADVIRHRSGRHPARRLKIAADVIVHVLRENEKKGFVNGEMARQDLRDATLLHSQRRGLPVRDIGLLDNVISKLDNVIIGNHIVCRTLHTLPRTKIKIWKYTVHDLPGVYSEKELPPQSLPSQALVPDVYSDVLYLYKNVLLAYPESKLVELATQVVLNTRHFVKEYRFGDKDEQEQFLDIPFPSMTDSGNHAESGSYECPPGIAT